VSLISRGITVFVLHDEEVLVLFLTPLPFFGCLLYLQTEDMPCCGDSGPT